LRSLLQPWRVGEGIAFFCVHGSRAIPEEATRGGFIPDALSQGLPTHKGAILHVPRCGGCTPEG